MTELDIAVATDTIGQTGSDSISVTVDNGVGGGSASNHVCEAGSTTVCAAVVNVNW